MNGAATTTIAAFAAGAAAAYAFTSRRGQGGGVLAAERGEDAGLGACTSGRPAQPGNRIADVETPALVVDLDAAEDNMRHLETQCSAFPNVVVRPHIKSHKCPELAKLQLARRAVKGLCCAKVAEVEAMASAGILDLHLANEVVDPRKIDRACAIVEQHGLELSVCVDDADNAAEWSTAAVRRGIAVGVLVEVNTGQNRCGVETVDEAADLAERVCALPGLRFRGIQGYHGAAQHIRDALHRGKVIMDVIRKVRAAVAAIEGRGIKVEVVTGAGTGTYPFEAGSGSYTEIQPGSYVFHDADYAKNPDAPWAHSLFVLAQVMSTNRAGGWCVVDAGLKSHSIDTGMPVLHGRPDVECRNGGDEHFILQFPRGEALPAVGTKLRLVPNHCDPTCNMHDWLVAVRGDTVEHVWRVHRGPGR